MRRTTILADDATLDRLRALAAERGVAFSVVVREALEAKAREFRPRPKSLGIGQSRVDTPVDWDRRVPPRAWR